MLKQMENYYKNIFGKDVFEKLDKDVLEGYKEISLEYANKQYFGETTNMSYGDALKYLYEKSKQDPCTIEKEVEGDVVVALPNGGTRKNANQLKETLTEEIEEDNMIISRMECDITQPTLATMKMVVSDAFLLDIVYQILKQQKMKLNENEKNYCELVSDVKDVATLQMEFEKFRRNGRKKILSGTEVSKMSHYGNKLPIDANVVAQIGKKTRIENVVPNIFRLFIMSDELRKLYDSQDVKFYKFGRIIQNLEQLEFNLSLLEACELEKILGINLAIQTTNALGKDTWEELTNVDKNKLSDKIEMYLKEIMEWEGPYCRCKLVKAINGVELPGDLYKGNYITQAENKINYMCALTRILRKSMIKSYSLMYGLIETFVLKKKDTTEDRITYIEEKILPGIAKNMFESETYLYLKELYEIRKCAEKDEWTYSIVQKKIIMNQIPSQK